MHVKQTDDALSRQWVGGNAETANDPRPAINPVISWYLAAEKEAERFAALAAPRAVLRQRSMRYRSLRWPPCVALLCCFVLYAGCVMLCCATSTRLYCVRCAWFTRPRFPNNYYFIERTFCLTNVMCSITIKYSVYRHCFRKHGAVEANFLSTGSGLRPQLDH